MERVDEREQAARLGIQLEAALVRALSAAWGDLNASYFRRKLKPPAIELSDATSRLGQWDPSTRVLSISRALATTSSWGVTLEVLKHEMAHQYVHEGLGLIEETAHGPAFRDTCKRLGIDASATGMPSETSGEASSADAKILERIARLLALAESTNMHEAEAAMSAAQRLMLKYNIDAAKGGAARGYGFRHLGAPTGRVSESERILGNLLGEHFFVEVIWVPVYRPLDGKRGHVLEICGTTANLEMAAYVHSFLIHTAASLWRSHRRERGIRGNRDRRTYVAGVMAGFRDKLLEEKRLNQERGLVWVRDADLHGFYRRRHPHIQHTRYAGNARTEAHAEGRAAGRRIELHRPVGASGANGPKLLPGRR